MKTCLWVLALCGATVAAQNPIYEAADSMKLVQTATNGALYKVTAPDAELQVLHVAGTAHERGVAQGTLMADQLYHFVVEQMPEFYKQEVDELEKALDGLPAFLKEAIEALLKSAAPQAFNLALDFVYGQQKDLIAASKAGVWDELDGMAEGTCAVRNAAGASPACNPADLAQTLRRVNLLPELIQMQCSMLGAWGAATPKGGLVQMRTLDFGAGPFANNSVLVVHHPTDSDFDFASLSFPGFAGAVTGWSEHLAQSEKVDDVAGGARPKGSYKGQAVAMVIRDQLQFAKSKEDALAIAQAAQRTWSVWLGFGDFVSQRFEATLYTQASAEAYDDVTLPSLTSQAAVESVAFLDKHPQPSADTLLHDVVRDHYGNLTAATIAREIPRRTASGDVHIAVYDLAAKRVLLSTGYTTADTKAFARNAHESPFFAFDMQALWDVAP